MALSSLSRTVLFVLLLLLYIVLFTIAKNDSGIISYELKIKAKLHPQIWKNDFSTTNDNSLTPLKKNQLPYYEYDNDNNDVNDVNSIPDNEETNDVLKNAATDFDVTDDLTPAYAGAPFPSVVYYRVTIYITNVPFVDDLRNADSDLFQTTSDNLAQSLEDLYSNIPGEHYVTVLKFEPVGGSESGSLASLDIGTLDNGGSSRVEDVMLNALESGQIGRFIVTKDKFSFRQVSTQPTPQPTAPSVVKLPVTTHSTCAHYEFQCRDQTCIDARRRCDGKPHCPDHSDESKDWGRCNLDPTVQLDTADITLNTGEALNLRGKIENLGNGTVLWTKDDSKIIAVGNAVVVPDNRFAVVFNENTNQYDLTLQRTKDKDSGRYTMVVDLRDRKLTRSVNVRILGDGLSSPNEQPVTIPWTRPRPTDAPTRVPSGNGGHQGQCESGYYECQSRHCLELHRWCDGRPDCPDQDDEKSCGNVLPAHTTPETTGARTCDSHEFQCRYVGNCIPNANRCNGVYDCSDCSDEVGCPGKTPCRKGDFKCESGECISQDRRCDGRSDCEDGSDERQCDVGARCQDGSMPEFSAYGVYYCWNSAMCPVGTMCKHGICCRSNGQKRCTSDQFECASDMKCIPRSLMCNQQYDCRDGSDEVLSICVELSTSATDSG